MELSPAKQRLLFVVVVIGLVALGIFVIRGRSDGNAAAPAATPTPTPTQSSAAASGAATGASAPASSPAASLAGATPPATAGANIYQWLPFTQSDLSAAAKTTLAFANVYANTSYTETNAAYAGKLAGLTTTQEAATLEDGFETVGIRATRTEDKQVATGTPTIESINSFGAAPTLTITFNVTIAQRLVSTSGTMNSTPEYTITTVSTGTSWQVSNIQLFSVGD
jgi:hypothetical protein